MTGSTAVIELVDVGKTYESGSLKVEALKGVDLRIEQGEFVAIVGPSGSGKSTLMHIVGCLDVPTSGQLILAGEDVADFDEDRLADVRNRYIGFVFQQFNLLSYMTALRNVELPLVYSGIGPAERRELALRALDLVGLGDRADHRPGELSGGQQQRVAIARALVTEPALLLADEPTGNLDSSSTGEILELLRQLHDAGRTIVLITHEPSVADQADHVVHILDGAAVAARGDPGMTWRDTLRTAGEAVRSHRLRSALTVLGILIGITAVILSVGIGNGASAQVRDQINELGTNILVVSPGAAPTAAVSAAASGRHRRSPCTTPTRSRTSPSRPTSNPSPPSRPRTRRSPSVRRTGPRRSRARHRHGSKFVPAEVTAGRFITDEDVQNDAAVVVLGPDTAQQLFSGRNPVGQTVTYNGSTLQVIGVLTALSSSENTSSNDVAIVPFTTYSQRLVGGTNRDSVSSIYVKATSNDTLSAAYQEAQTLLVNLHGSTSTANADFSIATQESILSAATTVDQTMSVMLAGIAIISLLVGGIGVMNIMLVSVTERIREIGLRKALGARPRLIRRQFLVEASALGFAGGALGVLVGVVAAAVVPKFTDTRFILSSTPRCWRSSSPSASASPSASTPQLAPPGSPRSTRCEASKRATRPSHSRLGHRPPTVAPAPHPQPVDRCRDRRRRRGRWGGIRRLLVLQPVSHRHCHLQGDRAGTARRRHHRAGRAGHRRVSHRRDRRDGCGEAG